jgi:ribosomal protein L31
VVKTGKSHPVFTGLAKIKHQEIFYLLAEVQQKYGK